MSNIVDLHTSANNADSDITPVPIYTAQPQISKQVKAISPNDTDVPLSRYPNFHECKVDIQRLDSMFFDLNNPDHQTEDQRANLFLNAYQPSNKPLDFMDIVEPKQRLDMLSIETNLLYRNK